VPGRGPVLSATVRAATVADAAALAELKVCAWRAAYGGVLPAELLAALDPTEEREAWARYLETVPPGDRLWLAEEGGELVGYARTGPAEDADLPPETGELYGLYVEPERIGTGLGRRLLVHALDDLRDRGLVRVAIWHFAGNEVAARFYERADIRVDGSRRQSDLGADEVRRVALLA
jgi:GNAT superfamily N-acetyltransferase